MQYKIAPFFDKEYPITQRYGENKDYYAQFGLQLGHEGIDYATPNGTPVLSPFDGTILRDSYNDKDYGNFTVVWDPIQKCALWFCHLQDITTSVGDTVKKGQLLGHTNNTGNSTGPHCHVNFVQTDDQGNRLNKDNGNQGFLDLLSYAEITSTPTVDPQTLDDLRIARDNNWNLYQAELSKNTELSKKNGDLTNEKNGYQQDIQTLQRQIQDLGDQVSKIKAEDITLSKDTIDAQHERDALSSNLQALYTALSAENQEEAITSIKTLQTPHQEVVKQYSSLAKAFEESALYKRAPKKTRTIIDKILSFFS